MSTRTTHHFASRGRWQEERRHLQTKDTQFTSQTLARFMFCTKTFLLSIRQILPLSNLVKLKTELFEQVTIQIVRTGRVRWKWMSAHTCCVITREGSHQTEAVSTNTNQHLVFIFRYLPLLLLSWKMSSHKHSSSCCAKSIYGLST